jgi:hypothetical protein
VGETGVSARRAFLLAVGLFTLTCVPARAASREAIAFVLSRGAGAEMCPDHDVLATQVEERLAQSRTSPHAPVADKVAIVIERKGSAFVATVSMLSNSGFDGGTRRLVATSRDCAGLAEALSLTLAMIADGRPLSDAKSPEVSDPLSSPARRPWELGAGVLGASNLLGAPTVGYALDAIWHPRPRLAAGVTGMWMPERKIYRAPGLSKVSIESALARICWGMVPFGDAFFPALCGQLGTGVLQGSSEGYADARSTLRLWLAAGASVRAGLHISKTWSVTAQAGALYPLRHEQFTIGGLGSVYESSQLSWLAGIDLHARIW